MKISEMLEREDFYTILEQTLSNHRHVIHATDAPIKVVPVGVGCSMFVNSRLNAILSIHPSKAVKDYLKTEYNVSGSLQRRLAVKGYLWTSINFINKFAHKGIEVQFDKGANQDDILIYPCNKKIRLFDFNKGIVYSMLKFNFPSLYIDREIEFRLTHKESFIPQIEKTGNDYYSEKIINGVPLARINDLSFAESCKEKAYKLLMQLTKTDEIVNAQQYINSLKWNCLDQLKRKKIFLDSSIIDCIYDSLLTVEPTEQISLVISHGDLQPGNIWWDEDRKQIVIIDWETVKKRSRFYDHAALYYNLRREGTKQQVIERIKNSSHIASYTPQCSPISIAKIVMAEELAYQTEELISFPGEIGIKEYNQVIEQFKTLKI